MKDTIVKTLARCYHMAHHPAAATERPIHMVYFILVATHGGVYGTVAGLCAVVMLFTIREDK